MVNINTIIILILIFFLFFLDEELICEESGTAEVIIELIV